MAITSNPGFPFWIQFFSNWHECLTQRTLHSEHTGMHGNSWCKNPKADSFTEQLLVCNALEVYTILWNLFYCLRFNSVVGNPTSSHILLGVVGKASGKGPSSTMKNSMNAIVVVVLNLVTTNCQAFIATCKTPEISFFLPHCSNSVRLLRFSQPQMQHGRIQDFGLGGPMKVWPKGGPEPKICSKWGFSLKIA